MVYPARRFRASSYGIYPPSGGGPVGRHLVCTSPGRGSKPDSPSGVCSRLAVSSASIGWASADPLNPHSTTPSTTPIPTVRRASGAQVPRCDTALSHLQSTSLTDCDVIIPLLLESSPRTWTSPAYRNVREPSPRAQPPNGLRRSARTAEHRIVRCPRTVTDTRPYSAGADTTRHSNR